MRLVAMCAAFALAACGPTAPDSKSDLPHTVGPDAVESAGAPIAPQILDAVRFELQRQDVTINAWWPSESPYSYCGFASWSTPQRDFVGVPFVARSRQSGTFAMFAPFTERFGDGLWLPIECDLRRPTGLAFPSPNRRLENGPTMSSGPAPTQVLEISDPPHTFLVDGHPNGSHALVEVTPTGTDTAIAMVRSPGAILPAVYAVHEFDCVRRTVRFIGGGYRPEDARKALEYEAERIDIANLPLGTATALVAVCAMQ